MYVNSWYLGPSKQIVKKRVVRLFRTCIIIGHMSSGTLAFGWKYPLSNIITMPFPVNVDNDP